MDELEALLRDLEPVVIDDFSGVLGRALSVLGLAQVDLARGVGASPSAVSRWQNGVSTPGAITQKAAIRWLRRRALRKLRIERNAAAIIARNQNGIRDDADDVPSDLNEVTV